MDLELRGKSVLITGASKGIGLACARGFAAEGANVHLAARSAAAMEAAVREAVVAGQGTREIGGSLGTTETGDYIALGRRMEGVKQGDLLAVMSAGAYGAVMASTYNSRPLVPEVMVDGNRWAVVAERLEPATILAAEHVPDWLA